MAASPITPSVEADPAFFLTKPSTWAIWGFLMGFLTAAAVFSGEILRPDFFYSLLPEAVGIVFTAFVIEAYARRRAQEQFDKGLLMDIRSGSNDLALRAIEELRSDGRLGMGFLSSKDLNRANFHQAIAMNVNLNLST